MHGDSLLIESWVEDNFSSGLVVAVVVAYYHAHIKISTRKCWSKIWRTKTRTHENNTLYTLRESRRGHYYKTATTTRRGKDEDESKTKTKTRQDEDKTTTRQRQNADKNEDKDKTRAIQRQDKDKDKDKTKTRQRQYKDKTTTRLRQDEDKTKTKTKTRQRQDKGDKAQDSERRSSIRSVVLTCACTDLYRRTLHLLQLSLDQYVLYYRFRKSDHFICNNIQFKSLCMSHHDFQNISHRNI